MNRRLRTAVLEIARSRPFERAVGLVERLGDNGALPVLTYHRVDHEDARPDLDPALISATPEEFERQMAWLAANRTPLALGELLAFRDGRATLPPRAVLVTFDDAYRDFADNAAPVLLHHGVPVTLFVPTAYPGVPDARFWWDRLHCALRGRRDAQRELELLRSWVGNVPHDTAMAELDRLVDELGGAPPAPAVLSWDALRELERDGVTLAPHSRTHPRLDRLPADRVRAEITGARADLLRETGHCAPAFAFPGGGYDRLAVQVLAEEGFELAFTTRRGSNPVPEPDWLGLRRTNVGRRASLALIRAQLAAVSAVWR